MDVLIMNDTNELLLDLYQKNYNELYKFKANEEEVLNGPFLINPNSKYYSSPLKLAFVGQETRGWACSGDIANQLETYSDFNLGKNYYASPFWNIMRKFEIKLIEDQYCSAWLNLNRYDENEGKPSSPRLAELSSIDHILVKELQLISPDIIIFFTGPDYDERILKLLEATKNSSSPFTSRQFCEFKSSILSAKIYRTYHPNYLRRSGLERLKLSEMLDTIQRDINN
jgi:hypothetical protein